MQIKGTRVTKHIALLDAAIDDAADAVSHCLKPCCVRRYARILIIPEMSPFAERK
jgi:hypothetical protein